MTDGSATAERGVELRGLLDRSEIADAVNSIATLADARNWEALRSVFADEIEVDYTSLVGDEPATLRAEGLIEGWRAALSGYDATQHAVTNHLARVDGDVATCSTYVVAQHYLLNYKGGDLWALGGRYDYRLLHAPEGWKVSAIKLTVLWAEGNQLLPELARRRFEEGLDGRGY